MTSWQANILRLWAKRLGAEQGELNAEVERLVTRAIDAPETFVLAIQAELQRKDQAKAARQLAEVIS